MVHGKPYAVRANAGLDGIILYALEDGGTLTAMDAESGQVIYREGTR